MRRKTPDINMPIGKLTKITDFLPPPRELAVAEDRVKITISLKKSSVDIFKYLAHRYHTKYQRMIRELVDKYAIQYS